MDIIINFLEDAKKFYYNTILNRESIEDYITCFLWDRCWDTHSKIEKRDLDTIYLDSKIKDDCYNTVKKFLDKDTKNLYKRLGIPYKLNILFEGVPGSGKSSLVKSIASELNLNIAILYFNKDLDDIRLSRAIKKVPKNTILLLEDIDTLFVERKKNDDFKNAVSFSGLLNFMDGMSYKNGLIIFASTNHSDKLDPALIRPGRVDKIYHFDFIKKEQANEMYTMFFPNNNNFDDLWNQIKNIKITAATLQQIYFKYYNQELTKQNINDIMISLKKIEQENETISSSFKLYT